MIRILTTLFLIVICSICEAQPSSRVQRTSLINDSSTIATGVVLDEWWVVNQAKMSSAMTRREISNPAEYVVGRIVRLRVDDVLKRDRQVRTGNTISIFILGWARLDGTPNFVKGRRHLVFLSRLNSLDHIYDKTTIYKPEKPSREIIPFDRKSAYLVTGNEYGAVQLSADNRKAIEEIKTALRNRR